MAGLQRSAITVERKQGTTRVFNSYFDPQGLLLTKLNPAPNQTPSATNGWNNYGTIPSTPQNRWEVTGKVTYAFNDNNKLWGSYTLQTETDEHPLSVWWAPEWTIPYPCRASCKGNGSRLPGQLHPRVQRHDDQRIRVLVC